MPLSRKSWEPSSAGCIDRGSAIAQVFEVKPKNTISAWLKALASLAFVLALVLSPPSASHAASGMHGDHHAAPVSSDHSDANHVHDGASSISNQEQHASISNMGADDLSSGQYCNDICLSAVLNDSGHNFVVQVSGGKYQPLHAQAASVEPSGFLRPPQFLI